ncbi:hypothetical protein B566_EDAN009873 [Ephemera danica]|nr:hypothetical protein B566_EDAN009873 [Ephemera danica]
MIQASFAQNNAAAVGVSVARVAPRRSPCRPRGLISSLDRQAAVLRPAFRAVVLHTHSELTISQLDLNGFEVLNWTHSEDDRNFLTLTLNASLEVSQLYTLEVVYTGILNDQLEGFYRSRYQDAQNSTRWLAVSMFAPTGARRAFPCFDEPRLKANFTLHIAHEPDYLVLSNMPSNGADTPLDDPELPGWLVTHFQTSVKMSTYLVAFSVNQFVNITNPEDPSFKVWARPEGIQQGENANAIAPKIVEYMTWYTNFSYALDKLDQVAIPDFAANAMENWGLITFRETALLFTEGVSTSMDRQRVETIVTHEIAHQWFGNLVTPAWWSVVWLSEGFATYFEYDALSTYRDWELREQFVQREMQFVMQQDATEGTHPMLAFVNSTYTANAVFDDIVYIKGASIIRMLVNMMGHGSFRSGICDYILENQFDNADMSDLWEVLGRYVLPESLPSGETLANIMDTWTLQPGYPVIKVTRDYDDVIKGALVTQERFMTQRDPGVVHDEKWMVPLTVNTAEDEGYNWYYRTFWHTGPEIVITGLNATSDQYVVFNVQEYGYYRVNYDQRNWQLLSASQLKLHPLNRAQMMDDALALARASMLDYTTALDTTRYLDTERDYVPWSAGLAGLSYLWDRLSNQSDSRANIEWYLLDELTPIYNELGGLQVEEGDSHVLCLKRNLILKIAPDLKSIVYCEGTRQGGQAEYDFLFMRYTNASNYASILTALGCATDQALLETYLWASITPDSGIRSQNSRDVYTAVYSNYWGVDIALDFLLENYFEALPYYSTQFGTIDRLFGGISVKLNTQEHRDKLQTFADTTDLGEAEGAVRDAIKTVDEILAWHEAHREVVLQYFADLMLPPNPTSASLPTLTTALLLGALLSYIF